MTHDARAQNYIPATLVCEEISWRVLVFRFSATGLSFYAPLHGDDPSWAHRPIASLQLELPDGSTFSSEGRILGGKTVEAPGVGRCLLVEMQFQIENRTPNPTEGSNRRRTPRIDLKNNQPRCIVTHPLLTHIRMEFQVCDVSASGMRLTTSAQVAALFPQFVFSGEIVFSDNSHVAVRFVARHVHVDPLTSTSVVGAQFVDTNLHMLSELSRKLLTTCRIDADSLRQSRLHYVFPAPQSRQAIPLSPFAVRVVENLDEWQRVLEFRLAAMRAAGHLKEKADIRTVMTIRDPLSTHLVACASDGQIVATGTLLQVARLGDEQRRQLPYGHHTDTAFDSFWDFSQYFLSPLHPPQQSLAALIGFALDHAAEGGCPCLVASVPPEWSAIFDAMPLVPTVIEKSEGPTGALSAYYFLAGNAQERYLTQPLSPTNDTEETGALSLFFKKILPTNDNIS